jgi:hypothetical protein
VFEVEVEVACSPLVPRQETMAGVAPHKRRSASRRPGRAAALGVGALLALVGLILAGALAPTAGAAQKKLATKSARKAACASIPSTLYPSDPAIAPEDRFTMIFRVNSDNDVDTFASQLEANGGLKPRIKDRDIFLINTRNGNDEGAEQEIATRLRQNFPCNRIFALNGESLNPTSNGYLFRLIDDPDVSALLMDWEKMDWDVARASEPGLAPWVDPFAQMLPIFASRLAALRISLSSPGRSDKLFGAVPFARADWNLGAMARVIQRQNSQLAIGRQGFQSVQTQKSCQTGGPAGMASQIKLLFTQYKKANFKKIKRKGKGKKSGKKRRPRFKKVKPKLDRGNLGVQISFTATPNPASPDPVKSVGPSTAAQCTVAAVNATAGAILFWARPSDLDALFADPAVCALRPSPSGIC